MGATRFKEIYDDFMEKCDAERKRLNKEIEERYKDYFSADFPQLFIGNSQARVVVVNLNPRAESHDELGFDDCVDFGNKKYNCNDWKKNSGFDKKQIAFLKPFLSFTGDLQSDLISVCNDKLQLELIPFQSKNLTGIQLENLNLEPFIERIIDIIFLAERDYVIFNGKAFCSLLKPYMSDSEQAKIGKRGESMFALTFKKGSKEQKAVIFTSFAQQGRRVYGEKPSLEQDGIALKSFYDRFKAL